MFNLCTQFSQRKTSPTILYSVTRRQHTPGFYHDFLNNSHKSFSFLRQEPQLGYVGIGRLVDWLFCPAHFYLPNSAPCLIYVSHYMPGTVVYFSCKIRDCIFEIFTCFSVYNRLKTENYKDDRIIDSLAPLEKKKNAGALFQRARQCCRSVAGWQVSALTEILIYMQFI